MLFFCLFFYNFSFFFFSIRRIQVIPGQENNCWEPSDTNDFFNCGILRQRCSNPHPDMQFQHRLDINAYVNNHLFPSFFSTPPLLHKCSQSVFEHFRGRLILAKCKHFTLFLKVWRKLIKPTFSQCMWVSLSFQTKDRQRIKIILIEYVLVVTCWYWQYSQIAPLWD